MFGFIYSFFKPQAQTDKANTPNKSKSNDAKRSASPLEFPTGTKAYAAVAAIEYGADFNSNDLYKGNFDEIFKDSLAFAKYCQLFSTQENAITGAERRIVTVNSSYIVGLSCSVAEASVKAKAGRFSEVITVIFNAKTRQKVKTQEPDLEKDQKSSATSPSVFSVKKPAPNVNTPDLAALPATPVPPQTVSK